MMVTVKRKTPLQSVIYIISRMVERFSFLLQNICGKNDKI